MKFFLVLGHLLQDLREVFNISLERRIAIAHDKLNIKGNPSISKISDKINSLPHFTTAPCNLVEGAPNTPRYLEFSPKIYAGHSG